MNHPKNISLNTPEPMPHAGVGADIWELCIEDMRERNAIGARKYGQTLRAGDGRKHLVDAYQELLDLCVYLRQEIEERTLRQRRVLQWAVDSFGPVATNRLERAARVVEEAMEICQAEGLSLSVVSRIGTHVYSKPAGQLYQEIGGLAITLDALAENAGFSVDQEAQRELTRILSKPKEWWANRHAAKVAAGTANLGEKQ